MAKAPKFLATALLLCTSALCVKGDSWDQLRVVAEPSVAAVKHTEISRFDRIIPGPVGHLALASDTNLVFLSSDNGTSWSVKTQGANIRVSAVSFLDARNAWEVGEEPGGAFLASTTDGGDTWSEALHFSTPRAMALMDVNFYDKNLGLALGSIEEQSLILLTTDGGRSWRVSLIETQDPDILLRRVVFRSHTEIWVVGGSSIYGEFSAALPSGDGNWAKLGYFGFLLAGLTLRNSLSHL